MYTIRGFQAINDLSSRSMSASGPSERSKYPTQGLIFKIGVSDG